MPTLRCSTHIDGILCRDSLRTITGLALHFRGAATVNSRSDVAVHTNLTNDQDAGETQEWLEALEGVLHCSGSDRCKELLLKLYERASCLGLGFEMLFNTPYCNTIAPSNEPVFPGDLDLERRIAAIV